MALFTIQSVNTAHPYYAKTLTLREAVLRTPLGLTLTQEDFDADRIREHLIAIEGDAVIGNVSFYFETPGVMRVKQMAVDPACQGKGIGALLLNGAEARARELGAITMRANARVTALPFYLRQGYVPVTEEFIEIGIAHRYVEKQL